jgi:hypothetical protein
MSAPAAPAPPTPTPPARRRDALGTSALVLGVIGTALGLFATYTWFVVLPLGLLTTIFGIADVTRSRHDVSANGRIAVIGIIAGAVTLTLGVWGTGMFLNGLNQLSHGLSDPRPVPATVTGPLSPVDSAEPVTWGQRYTFDNGIAVSVTPPAAVPQSTRSIELTVTVTNHGLAAYLLDQRDFGPVTTFDGILSTDLEPQQAIRIPAGAGVAYRVSYTLPRRTGRLRLEFRSGEDLAIGTVTGAV